MHFACFLRTWTGWYIAKSVHTEASNNNSCFIVAGGWKLHWKNTWFFSVLTKNSKNRNECRQNPGYQWSLLTTRGTDLQAVIVYFLTPTFNSTAIVKLQSNKVIFQITSVTLSDHAREGSFWWHVKVTLPHHPPLNFQRSCALCLRPLTGNTWVSMIPHFHDSPCHFFTCRRSWSQCLVVQSFKL